MRKCPFLVGPGAASTPGLLALAALQTPAPGRPRQVAEGLVVRVTPSPTTRPGRRSLPPCGKRISEGRYPITQSAGSNVAGVNSLQSCRQGRHAKPVTAGQAPGRPRASRAASSMCPRPKTSSPGQKPKLPPSLPARPAVTCARKSSRSCRNTSTPKSSAARWCLPTSAKARTRSQRVSG
jgi:hypothetical protein